MTEQQLNDLLYELESAGYDAQDIHDAIENIEKHYDCVITDFEQLEACIKIVRWIDELTL